MIRINLLDSLPAGKRMHAALNPGGASTFISKREVLLGGAFLVLGVAILAAIFHFGPQEEPGDEVPLLTGVSEQTEPQQPDAPAASTPAEPEPVESSPGGAEAPSAAGADEEAREPVEATETSAQPAASPERAAPERPSPLPSKPPLPAPAAPKPRNADRWAGAARLTGLTVTPLGSQLQIFLAVDGECEVKTFNLDNPDRVVVDLEPARLEMRTRTVEVGHKLLRQIRIAQNQIDPPKVRLVMDAGEFPDMIIVDRSGGFEFLVTPDQ